MLEQFFSLAYVFCFFSVYARSKFLLFFFLATKGLYSNLKYWAPVYTDDSLKFFLE